MSPIPGATRSRWTWKATAVVVLASLLGAWALPVSLANAQEANQDAAPPDTAAAAPDSVAHGSTLPPAMEIPRRPWLALGEIILIDALVWSFDRYLRSGDTSGFDIGPDTWWDNFQHGFEYDDNHFKTNQFAHPYQGNLNFNAARSNGYGYWGSVPFSFFGSWTWEYFGEANPPAINDWINTSLGGAAFGESMYRISSLILDDTDTGTSRVFREITATLLNPVRGFNRLIHGQMARVSQNPSDWRPNVLHLRLRGGVASTDAGFDAEGDSTGYYFELDMRYGDPTRGAYKKPFQTFLFQLHHDFGPSHGLHRLQAAGILYGKPLGDPDNVKSMFTAWQRYDYFNSPLFEFGGQSATIGYVGGYGSRYRLNLLAELGWLMLGATKTDYTEFTGRNYDYGMGGEARIEAEFLWKDRPVVYVQHISVLQGNLNGNPGRHRVDFTQARLNIPVTKPVGFGGEYLYLHRQSNYEDVLPDVTVNQSQYRLFLSLNL